MSSGLRAISRITRKIRSAVSGSTPPSRSGSSTRSSPANRWGLLAGLRARPHLLAAAGAGVLAYLALRVFAADALGHGTRVLLAWDAALIVFFGLTARLMFGATGEDIRERADELDEGAAGVLLLTVLATAVSVVAIAVELSGAKGAQGLEKALRSALGALTVLLSWLFVHVNFALHYAHAHYNVGRDEHGVNFPGANEAPDYWDFLYLSFNFGAAMQTSDVELVDAGIRRLALGQTVIAWIFNTTIIALAVSLGGDLLSGN